MCHWVECGHSRRRTGGLGPRLVAGRSTITRLELVGRSRRQHQGIHGRLLYPASARAFEGGSNADCIHQLAGTPPSSLSLGSFPIDRKGLTGLIKFFTLACIFFAPAIPFVLETRPGLVNRI